MKSVVILLIAVAFTFVSLPIASAQELPKTTKYENVAWYSIGYYKFIPSKAEDAQKLLTDYFIPADKAAGRAVINFTLLTGDWDHIAFFPMEGGASGLEYSVSPNEEKWWAALAKLAGGAGKARELMNKWNEMLSNSKSEVATRPIK